MAPLPPPLYTGLVSMDELSHWTNSVVKPTGWKNCRWAKRRYTSTSTACIDTTSTISSPNIPSSPDPRSAVPLPRLLPPTTSDAVPEHRPPTTAPSRSALSTTPADPLPQKHPLAAATSPTGRRRAGMEDEVGRPWRDSSLHQRQGVTPPRRQVPGRLVVVVPGDKRTLSSSSRSGSLAEVGRTRRSSRMACSRRGVGSEARTGNDRARLGRS